MQFADRLANVETSAIRELFKLLGRPGIVSFAGGFPDAALFDVEGVREAAQAALVADPAGALQYGATEGYGPLRASIAELLQAKGAPVSAEQLIVTTGSQQALDLLGKTLISPGDRVIVEAPTFLAAIQCFRLYGARLIGAPIDGEGVLVESLERLILEHRPKLIYLIPTFGNPSGATLSPERRRRVLELAVEYRVLVVEDDPYGELWFDHPPPPSLLALTAGMPAAREWLAHCGSLSKVLSPGLRLGWLVAAPELLTKAVMCKQFSDAHTSTFAQLTAQHYLASGRMAQAVARVRAAYGERARTMCAALERRLGAALSFVRPRGGMFVWARLTAPGADSAEFARRALDRGVAFVPGTPFFAEQPDRASFRLSYATSNLEQIEQGVARLAAAL
ncbi:MAG: PLP-dependent aminotransferase family protein [Casimicrobiaceae bacterium]|nr:PLP-dependent aminotransferase family protein [Casimicrobiaceae bacterium]MCX8099300.1 PLP-dependent aminotransferase family protein [Casimicrobiaceae bacterium]MDW8312352.1 PLP-dependent aminotransferase family protein [Burkholderiales bacterium]